MNSTLQRPTSPIDYEPPPLASGDYIYPGSDEEEPVEEQEAQRRRIQLQAQRYLQDGQLFILSAQLYGPFDGGWVNPWAGKRKREERNSGPAFDNGRMQVGGDTAGGRQKGESMTIPEITRPSRAWPNRENAIRTEILDSGPNSAPQTPAQQSPEGMLSTVTKLNSSGEDLHLLPHSKVQPAFEYFSLNREDGGGDLELENSNAIANAPEEMFRTPGFTLNDNMQELEPTSGIMSALNHEVTPARRLHKFNRKRREINKANNPSERDDISRGPSTILPVLFNETHSLEIRGQTEAIAPQPFPRKRRRLEENTVPSNADGESPDLNVRSKSDDANGAMTDTASTFKLQTIANIRPIIRMKP